MDDYNPVHLSKWRAVYFSGFSIRCSVCWLHGGGWAKRFVGHFSKLRILGFPKCSSTPLSSFFKTSWKFSTKEELGRREGRGKRRKEWENSDLPFLLLLEAS